MSRVGLICLVFILNTSVIMGKGKEQATLGGGCFWCTEAVYLQLNGVVDVKPGYSGGHVKNPSYREVCNETTGHAEVVQVTFDPETVSFSEILEVFFKTHDPPTLNRRGTMWGRNTARPFFTIRKQK
jgi:peptide-methionine (S)-S-oxide reductase